MDVGAGLVPARRERLRARIHVARPGSGGSGEEARKGGSPRPLQRTVRGSSPPVATSCRLHHGRTQGAPCAPTPRSRRVPAHSSPFDSAGKSPCAWRPSRPRAASAADDDDRGLGVGAEERRGARPRPADRRSRDEVEHPLLLGLAGELELAAGPGARRRRRRGRPARSGRCPPARRSPRRSRSASRSCRPPRR